MRRQTLSSLVLIVAMAGTVGLVAFVALMVVGDIGFSPALFFAIVAAAVAAVALFVGLFRDDEPSAHADRAPRPQDRTLTPKTFEAGGAGVEPGSAGVEPGSAGRSGPGATTGQFDYEGTEGDKPSTAVVAPGPASAGDQAGNAPSSAHGGMPSGNAVQDSGTGDEARPRGRPNAAMAGRDDERVHGASNEAGADRITIGAEPPRRSEPREGGPDDLTRIDGVDAEIRERLHKLGIFHFDQIAAWNRHEIVWIEESLGGLDGRIGRDDWVAQSETLSDARQSKTPET